MLDEAHAGPRRRRFLNISTGECIRMDLPELAEHRLLALTSGGLLVLFHERTLVVRLLNPLTRQPIDLPPVTALLTPGHQLVRRLGVEVGSSITVSGAALVAGTSTVAVSFYCPMVLALAKPGEEGWTVVDKSYMNSTLHFAGRIYCVSYMGVMALNVDPDQPRMEVAVALSTSMMYSAMKDSLHLVDNGGELMLVHRMLRRGNDDEKHRRKYEVYKVDLDAGILIPAKGFNGRAVFVGLCRAISVSAKTFPSVTADTLYLGSDCDMDTVGYNMSDGSSEPWHYNPFLDRVEHPCSVVDCLCFCIAGTDRLLG